MAFSRSRSSTLNGLGSGLLFKIIARFAPHYQIGILESSRSQAFRRSVLSLFDIGAIRSRITALGLRQLVFFPIFGQASENAVLGVSLRSSNEEKAIAGVQRFREKLAANCLQGFAFIACQF
jgi:hypothetical protein